MDKNNKESDGIFPGLSLLIRSIQRIEGNPDCFDTSGGFCDRYDCNWRCYCLKEPKNPCNLEYCEGGRDKNQGSGNGADQYVGSCSRQVIRSDIIQIQHTMRVNYA